MPRFLTAPLYRPWHLRCGATDAEVAAPSWSAEPDWTHQFAQGHAERIMVGESKTPSCLSSAPGDIEG
jgi:hypothetical protein